MRPRPYLWALPILASVALCLMARLAPGAGQYVRLVSQIGGGCTAVHVEGSYAYIGEGPNLVILDVSSPSNPTLVKKLLLPVMVRDVFVSGGIAYVLRRTWPGGLFIIDVSDPGRPTHLSCFDVLEPVAFHASGNLACVAAREWPVVRLIIMDISNPTWPRQLGTYPAGGGTMPCDLFVSGNLVYFAKEGLQIIDISNPSSPTLRGSIPTLGDADDVCVDGGMAYVAFTDWGLPRAVGFQIIDVSDPTSPTVVGTHQTWGYSLSIAVSGTTAYLVTGSGQSLEIVDVSDPTSPALLGSHRTDDWPCDVHVSGGVAYVADVYGGLQVVNVTDPSSPGLLAMYVAPGGANGVCVSGDLAYVAWSPQHLIISRSSTGHPADEFRISRTDDISDPLFPVKRGFRLPPGRARDMPGLLNPQSTDYPPTSSLKIVDVSDPLRPWIRGGLDVGAANAVDLSGDLAYVASNEGLHIVDVSDPSSPMLCGSYRHLRGEANHVRAIGELAYVTALSDDKLYIIDASDPSRPTLHGSYEAAPTWIWDVDVSGDFAFIAVGDDGLWVLDISDPSSPTLHGQCETTYGTYGVRVFGSIAYILEFTAGAGPRLGFVDVSDPSSPTLIGYHDSGGEAIHVFDGLAYIANGGGSIEVVDVSDPSSPTLCGWYRMPGFTEDIYVSDGLVYVAARESGLWILEYVPPPLMSATHWMRYDRRSPLLDSP